MTKKPPKMLICFCVNILRLKIRVSAVQFCPEPPSGSKYSHLRMAFLFGLKELYSIKLLILLYAYQKAFYTPLKENIIEIIMRTLYNKW